MGVWSALNEIEAAIDSDLSDHIATVASERGESLKTDFTLFPRERAETFKGKAKAGVGIWFRSARTGGVRQSFRHWHITAVIDYAFTGDDRSEIATQVELVLEATMLLVDSLATTGTLLGAGESEQGTLAAHDLAELIQEGAGVVTQGGPLVAGFRLTVPVTQEDQITA